MPLVPRLDPRSIDCVQWASASANWVYCISTLKVCKLYMAFIQLYIEHRSRKDYVIQERVVFKRQYFSENESGNF